MDGSRITAPIPAKLPSRDPSVKTWMTSLESVTLTSWAWPRLEILRLCHTTLQTQQKKEKLQRVSSGLSLHTHAARTCQHRSPRQNAAGPLGLAPYACNGAVLSRLTEKLNEPLNASRLVGKNKFFLSATGQTETLSPKTSKTSSKGFPLNRPRS